jgi:Tol biopolymer transport system component
VGATARIGTPRRRWVAALAVLTLLLSACSFVARVSVNSSNTQATGLSGSPSVSADGRYIAFESTAPDLVADDTNQQPDVFVRDLVAGTTVRVSVTSEGAEVRNANTAPSISADGRFVAFESSASDLVADDTNLAADVFVHDRVAGTTERVSLTSAGGQSSEPSIDPAISADGRFVAFRGSGPDLVAGDTNNSPDIFVRDRVDGTTSRVSLRADDGEASLSSWAPAISADGRFVAFQARGSNLVPGDANDQYDVFVRDRSAGTTTLVSVDLTGVPAELESWSPSISGDGRFVAFHSGASDLVPGDTEGYWDVFVRDLVAGTTRRVSVATGGAQANQLSQVSTISSDGRRVAFQSYASNLTPGDTNGNWDVFVRDLVAGTTRRISTDTNGVQGNAYSWAPAISGDGRFVAYQSASSKLVPLDTNRDWDVFVTRTSQPLVTSVTPASATRGSTVALTVRGAGFFAPVDAHLGGGVVVAAVSVVSETEVRLQLEIPPDAHLGPLSVTVFDTGGLGLATASAGQCASCFTVRSAP